ncbi:hypothetical protein BN946_scf184895.g12 [Trametes cinnabarina]|uniref:Uncharacterized protein n=1 Tax=Pycnoporus cinnabarinus TaxID=5643 RepID=A0A060SL35_PYCCI|nr:hypothetical protein BN946_scf184895.g12 [Trametes cinnabarina]
MHPTTQCVHFHPADASSVLNLGRRGVLQAADDVRSERSEPDRELAAATLPPRRVNACQERPDADGHSYEDAALVDDVPEVLVPTPQTVSRRSRIVAALADLVAVMRRKLLSALEAAKKSRVLGADTPKRDREATL